MTVENTTNDKPTGNDIKRYRANYLAEQEGVYLYSKLAEAESDAHLAELYRRLAAIEQRHADLWKDYLSRAEECRRMAELFREPGQRQCLKLAEAWERLADKADADAAPPGRIIPHLQ